MALAFLIERSNQYRLLAPIIDAALGDGWSVECWHDQSQPREGIKADQVPDAAAVPRFVHGEPLVKSYRERGELRGALQTPRVDAVVSLQTAPFYFGDSGYDGPPWLWLHSVRERLWRTTTPRRPLVGERGRGVDSPWWVHWGSDNFQAEGQLRDGSTAFRARPQPEGGRRRISRARRGIAD